MFTESAPTLAAARDLALAKPVLAFAALVVITALWATWASRNL
jgi:hypothetical protein